MDWRERIISDYEAQITICEALIHRLEMMDSDFAKVYEDPYNLIIRLRKRIEHFRAQIETHKLP